ncbi:uncharacterized protein C8Q71DRAFT_727408 [Rhodofomes roseus]|uniref:Uncharacterized protein n=1 Tax=Rhodofomes roseus TaxID=34475 RepID=A0ABQ8K1T0_9APHY|nr:uncharacterized protein C8Q71DRAFT_727408 [Rhodofomes roseus]KAH9830671.1 hypothetical protein C8Q71DRAFT_727408 [Rhodofomes roseus]
MQRRTAFRISYQERGVAHRRRGAQIVGEGRAKQSDDAWYPALWLPSMGGAEEEEEAVVCEEEKMTGDARTAASVLTHQLLPIVPVSVSLLPIADGLVSDCPVQLCPPTYTAHLHSLVLMTRHVNIRRNEYIENPVVGLPEWLHRRVYWPRQEISATFLSTCQRPTTSLATYTMIPVHIPCISPTNAHTFAHRHRAEVSRPVQIGFKTMVTCVSRRAEAVPELLRPSREMAQRKFRGPSRGAGDGCRDTLYLRISTILRLTLAGASVLSRQAPDSCSRLSLTDDLLHLLAFDSPGVRRWLGREADGQDRRDQPVSSSPIVCDAAVLLSQLKSACTHP